MFLSESGSVFLGFVLCMSGVQGQRNSICVLKGSSVDLPCSAGHPTSANKWYTVHLDGDKFVQNELSVDGSHVTYNMSENRPTLKINDVRDNDTSDYCCRENTDNPTYCKNTGNELQVADLQVKVFPTSEGQTVTLMCSSSCPLTEKLAAYIWYKNGEFLYQDWSPWYQQLVRSQEAVTYSCAIKGYEHLRAPEVSVDSVTSSCFSVTYAKGRMCSYQQTSEDEPCSITFPREVILQKTPIDKYIKLTCLTSCPLTDIKLNYSWYLNRLLLKYSESQNISAYHSPSDKFSCALTPDNDFLSAEVCAVDKKCWSVNYVSRRICAVEGSSVNISSQYLHPENQQPRGKLWYKMKRRSDDEEPIEAEGRVEYHDDMKDHHILRINDLKRDDSAEYTFRLNGQTRTRSDLPGVLLIVTGLEVKSSPSAVVTEGQRVSLTCSTSCPLTDNTSYIWYFNGGPLTLPQNQNKVLLVDPVSSQHAGNYSCAVKTHKISSQQRTLTVLSRTVRVLQETWTPAAAAGGVAALLVLTAVVVLRFRRKRTSRQTAGTETSDNSEQLNPDSIYENISARPAEQDEHHYSRLHLSKDRRDAVY